MPRPRPVHWGLARNEIARAAVDHTFRMGDRDQNGRTHQLFAEQLIQRVIGSGQHPARAVERAKQSPRRESR